jgi:hypothetical protein
MSTTTDAETVSTTEGRELLDRAARRWLNVSRDQFIAKWDAGDYMDDERLGVHQVAMLLPFGRA